MRRAFFMVVIFSHFCFCEDLSGGASFRRSNGDLIIAAVVTKGESGYFVSIENKSGIFCYVRSRGQISLREVDDDGGIRSKSFTMEIQNKIGDESSFLGLSENGKIVFLIQGKDIPSGFKRFSLSISLMARMPLDQRGELWEVFQGLIESTDGK